MTLKAEASKAFLIYRKEKEDIEKELTNTNAKFKQITGSDIEPDSSSKANIPTTSTQKQSAMNTNPPKSPDIIDSASVSPTPSAPPSPKSPDVDSASVSPTPSAPPLDPQDTQGKSAHSSESSGDLAVQVSQLIKQKMVLKANKESLTAKPVLTVSSKYIRDGPIPSWIQRAEEQKLVGNRRQRIRNQKEREVYVFPGTMSELEVRQLDGSTWKNDGNKGTQFVSKYKRNYLKSNQNKAQKKK